MRSESINDLIKEINQLSDYTFRGHLWARMSDTRPSVVVGLLNKIIIELPLLDLLGTTYSQVLEQLWNKLKVLMAARDKGIDIYAIEDYDKFFEISEVLYE